MDNKVLMAKGLFSELTISLSSDTITKLATIRKKDNPLAHIEKQLKAVLKDFERAYFELSQAQVTDLEPSDAKATTE